MPKVTYNQFVELLSIDMKTTKKMADKWVTGVINRIFTEALRGNTVVINGFGTFTPRVAGGKDEKYKYRVTDTPIVIDFSFSDGGIQCLNGEITSSETKNRIKNGNPTLYERVLLNLEEYEDDEKKLRRKRKLQDVEVIFNKIVKQRQEKVLKKLEEVDDDYSDENIDDENEKEKDDGES